MATALAGELPAVLPPPLSLRDFGSFPTHPAHLVNQVSTTFPNSRPKPTIAPTNRPYLYSTISAPVRKRKLN